MGGGGSRDGLRPQVMDAGIGDTTGPQIGIVIPGVKVELRAEIQKLGCVEGLTNKIYRLETAIL